MVYHLPTYQSLLRANQGLPDASRTSLVVLRFLKPFPLRLVNEFLRLHLTPRMLAGGEGEFYQPELSSPHRLKRPLCPGCFRPTAPVQPYLGRCVTPGCRATGKLIADRPARGVVRVLTQAELDAVLRRQPVPERWTQTGETPLVALVLDRRYHEIVLAAVYRTAGQLAEKLGWKVR